MPNPDEDHARKETGARDRRAKEQDLRATSDSIRTDADRLDTIEQSKTGLEPHDPTLRRLSDEAAKLGEELARKTRAEEQLATDLG
jgi:hypothetical protein